MNGFEKARGVEHRGMAILLPFLEERSTGYVLCNKGPMAKWLQATTGDVIYSTEGERVWTVEIKIEQKHTGNVFLETWSNRNLENRPSHIERGSNRGWLDHLRSDLLWYYFLDTDDLYIWNLFRLKQWAFGTGIDEGNIYRYPERRQTRYEQLNDTWGRLVPIQALAKECPYRHANPRQIPLFDEAA